MSFEEKAKLRDIMIKIFDKELDDNTFKKVLVLVCQLYPDDIKMVQLSFKKAREFLATSTGSKADLSLTINVLFQMEKV